MRRAAGGVRVKSQAREGRPPIPRPSVCHQQRHLDSSISIGSLTDERHINSEPTRNRRCSTSPSSLHAGSDNPRASAGRVPMVAGHGSVVASASSAWIWPSMISATPSTFRVAETAKSHESLASMVMSRPSKFRRTASPSAYARRGLASVSSTLRAKPATNFCISSCVGLVTAVTPYFATHQPHTRPSHCTLQFATPWRSNSKVLRVNGFSANPCIDASIVTASPNFRVSLP
jgi:hypothetical protein